MNGGSNGKNINKWRNRSFSKGLPTKFGLTSHLHVNNKSNLCSVPGLSMISCVSEKSLCPTNPEFNGLLTLSQSKVASFPCLG